MFSQLVEVPIHIIEEGDIVFDQAHNLLVIVIDIQKDFEKEQVKIRSYSKEEYYGNFPTGSNQYVSYEVRGYYSTIYKLVEIIEDDISALIRIKKEVDEKEDRHYIPSMEDVLEESKNTNQKTLSNHADLAIVAYNLFLSLSDEEQSLRTKDEIINLIKNNLKVYTGEELIKTGEQQKCIQVIKRDVEYVHINDYRIFQEYIHKNDELTINEIADYIKEKYKEKVGT